MWSVVGSAPGFQTENLALLAIASGIISLTLTRSTLTKKLRHKWIRVPILGELINCPFCMSFWTSLIFFVRFDSDGFHFWPIHWLVVTGLSCLYIGLLLKLWLLKEQELEDMRELLREDAKMLRQLAGQMGDINAVID